MAYSLREMREGSLKILALRSKATDSIIYYLSRTYKRLTSLSEKEKGTLLRSLFFFGKGGVRTLERV